ncbi:defense against restriction DarA-related protein, partial [Avibacterium paragallinarum]
MALNLTFWDNQQNPVNTTVEQLFDALRNDDMKAGLMYEPCTMDDVLDGTEPSNALIMDAIIAQYAKLTAKMNIMQRVMSRSGVDVKDSEGKTVPLTVVGYQISDPFMRLGTANVVALFELSDGQTVSIYFHNPDTTPKKITPQDEVISFKWLLNKKDITIVVAPEKGKDIDVRQVALRIMKIAAKNSAAFARQNKNRKERLERVNALRMRVAEKEKILAQKLKKIDELQYLKAQEEVDQLLEDERLMDSELNASLYAELKALDRLSDREDELDNIYQARVVAVRNMLRDKGWKGESYKELSKEGYVLTETYHYSKSGTNMIGVTYSILELNLSYTDELTDTPEAIAEMINEPVDKALKALRLSQVESDTEEDKLLIDEVEALINAGEVITLSQNEMEEKIKQVKNSLAYQNILTLQEKLAYMGIAYEPLGQRDYYIYRERISGWLDYYDLDMLKNTRSRLLKIQLDAFKQLPLEEKVGYGRHNLRTSINKEHWEQFYVLHPELSDLHIKNYAIYLVKLGGGEEKLNRRYEEKRLAQQEQPIVISGKEFGEFDTETEEGKKALREEAFNYLKGLAESGETVFCKALNANVGFSSTGAKKYKSTSGNPIKSKLATKIKEIIANAKEFKEKEQTYDANEKAMFYHYLKTPVTVNGESFGVRVVVREDHNGKFHYDLQVAESIEAILDGIDVEKATNLPSKYGESRLIQAQSELQPDNTAILNGKQVKNSLNPLLLDDTQQANLMIALNYAATLDEGVVIDATQLAQDQLEAALSVLENNLPINEQEGNIAQAELERDHIASIKEALSVLQSQPALDGVDDDGYVLNLFVEYKDENGNWVELKDEDEEVEPENSNAQPETIQSNPVLLHTSLLYKGEGYRPFLPGRDEEIEQFKQAGYMLEPFSVEGRSCTYSVHKTAEPYNIHITANWYS